MGVRTIIVLEKGGERTEKRVKEFTEEEVYKKCGFKALPPHFGQLCAWSEAEAGGTGNIEISIWGKTTGKSGQENAHVAANRGVFPFSEIRGGDVVYGDCVAVARRTIAEIEVDCGEGGDPSFTFIDMTDAMWEESVGANRFVGTAQSQGQSQGQSQDQSQNTNVVHTDLSAPPSTSPHPISLPHATSVGEIGGPGETIIIDVAPELVREPYADLSLVPQ